MQRPLYRTVSRSRCLHQGDCPAFLAVLRPDRAVFSWSYRHARHRRFSTDAPERYNTLSKQSGNDIVRSPLHTELSELLKRGGIQRAFEKLNEMEISPSVDDFGFLIHECVKNGRQADAFSLYEKMKATKVPPDGQIFEQLFQSCTEDTPVELIASLFHDMLDLGIQLDTANIYIFVQLFARLMKTDTTKLFALIEVAKTTHPHTVVWALNELIARLSRQNKMPTARLIFDEMVQQNIADVFTYKAAISGYSSRGDLQNILEVFTNMKKRNIQGNAAVYHNLLFTCVKKKEFKKALSFFDEMKEQGIVPDPLSYITMLHGCMTSGMVNRALSIFEEMKAKGVEISANTYSTLIRGCMQNRRVEKAYELFEEIKGRTDCKVDSFHYNALINGLMQRKLPAQALAIYADMKAIGMAPTLRIYTSLIHGCMRNNLPEKADEFFREMKEADIEPDMVLNVALLDGWLKAGMLEKAEAFFEETKNKPDAFNDFAYNTLIHAYMIHEMPEKAFALLESMRQPGSRTKPTTTTLNSLLDLSLKVRDTNRVAQVLEIMDKDGIEVDEVTITILVDGCVKGRMKENPVTLLEKYQGMNVATSPFLYTSLIYGFMKSGNPIDAFRYFEEMKTRQVVPSLPVFTALIDGCLKQQMVPEALAFMREMEKFGFAMDRPYYTALVFDYAIKNNDLNKAFEAFEEMKQNKIVPSCTTYTTLIDGCLKKGKRVLAFTLFEEMLTAKITPDYHLFNRLIKYCLTRRDEKSAEDLLELMMELDIKEGKSSFE